MAISLPSHRNCTTHIHTETKKKNPSLHKTDFCSLHRNLILVSKLKWSLQKIYGNLDHFSLGTFFLCTVCMPTYKRAGPRNLWRDQGPSNAEVIFSMIQDVWRSSEAVGLSQVTGSKMLPQLTGQISAHYSSPKIRNTHLRLFRPDQGPHTVQQYPISHKNPTIITFRMNIS